MITAHIPAGYVTGRQISASRVIVAAAVAGAVAPDLDFLRHYLIDHAQVHHHRYWTHIPLAWALIALVVVPAVRLLRPHLVLPSLAFFAGVLGHLVLDTIAGGILWLWPWSDRFVSLIDLPNRWPHWILDPILHPVFALEIAIWLWAATLWRRRSVA